MSFLIYVFKSYEDTLWKDMFSFFKKMTNLMYFLMYLNTFWVCLYNFFKLELGLVECLLLIHQEKQ